MIDEFFSHTLDSCPDCGGELLFSRKALAGVVQRAELIAKPLWITQGTRAETGRRWCERIWTTIATCARQGRSVFEFLWASIESDLRGAPPPSLLPSEP